MRSTFTPYKSVDCILEQSSTQKYPLYLGDVHSYQNQKVMSSIKTIICCIRGFQIEKKIKKNFDYNIIHFQIRDKKDEDISNYFDQSYIQIQNGLQVGGVLVHCFAGVSRSASIVVAYIMRKKQLNLEKALYFIKIRRSCICPNAGFMQQLKKYEQSIHSKTQQILTKIQNNIEIESNNSIQRSTIPKNKAMRQQSKIPGTIETIKKQFKKLTISPNQKLSK